MEYTATILRNKGVQVEVAVLAHDEDGLPRRTKDDHGNEKTGEKWVRFDANAIADIEEQFGNLAGFEEASRLTPFNAIRRVLSIVWQISPREAGMLMLDGKINDYSTAVGVALSIANGVDPTQAARLLRVGVTAGKKIQAERDKVMEETLVEAEAEVEEAEKAEVETKAQETAPDSSPTDASTGDGGPRSGSDKDGDTKSSGVTPLLRSPSPSEAGAGSNPNSGEEEVKVEPVAVEDRSPKEALSATS